MGIRKRFLAMRLLGMTTGSEAFRAGMNPLIRGGVDPAALEWTAPSDRLRAGLGADPT